MYLDPETIDDVFAVHEHQADVFIELHKLIYDGSAEDRPPWDLIKKLDGWPKMGPAVSKHIWNLFQKFDKAHHPEVMAGGLWFNSGWSTDETLDDWQIEPAPVILKEE